MAEPADNFRDLDTVRWDELEEITDRLEAAWKSGGPVELSPFLPGEGNAMRSMALLELIKVDMECRWRNGKPVVLDYYVDKYKELGGRRSLPAHLIYEEYRVRQRLGDKPPLTAYKQRFPTQFTELERLIRDQPIPTTPISDTPKTPVLTKPEA